MSLMNDFVYRMALTTCSYAAVDWDIYSFRCYTDNTFGNYSDYNGQCDYYYTGISEISNPTTITLSPNPATTTVTISISSFTANQQLIITDLLGREIERTTITNNQSIINVAQWNNGVYFYQLIDDKETKAGKFVVSH